jgi:hypothetical protein
MSRESRPVFDDLDHGTDLATFVDEIPLNEPTHAHGLKVCFSLHPVLANSIRCLPRGARSIAHPIGKNH